MATTSYVCTDTFIDRVTIAKGSRASGDPGDRQGLVRLTIVSPARGSDVHPGEVIHVPWADFQGLWQRV